MLRKTQRELGDYLGMLWRLGLVIAVGGAGLSSMACGAGLLPVLVGTGGFIAGANSQQGDAQDGLDGLNCWDLNGDGINDEEEDTSGDGQWTAADCRGADGEDGNNGLDGNTGLPGDAG